MKKTGIYIGLIAAGLIIGYFLFGKTTENSQTQHDHQHSTQKDSTTTEYWTCSMHPQIHKTEPGQCPICGMDLIREKKDAATTSDNRFKLTKTAMALANIETITVGQDSLSDDHQLELSGKIEANEKTNRSQVAYFDGRIEKLNINSTGETVHRGDLLATVYSPELVSAQEELQTAAESKQSNPQLYRAVRRKLKSWKLSDKQIDQLEQADGISDNFPIYATTSGTITEKKIEEGDYIKKGEVLFNIADLSTVWAVFDAYENQISQLSVGQPVTVSTKAYPDAPIEGKISFIEPMLNNDTRTVNVRVELSNAQGLLKPKMFVKAAVEFHHKQKSDIVKIPKSAVLWTGRRSVVYVKPYPDKSAFELREVELGKAGANSYQILSGLKKGEEIVSHGTFTVDAAAQLKNKPSMMTRE